MPIINSSKTGSVIKFIRFFCVLLASSLMPMGARELSLAAYADAPNAASVRVDNGLVLTSANRYLIDGAVSPGPATLGAGGCTAYFDPGAGTLELNGYSGGRIINNALDTAPVNLTIRLYGINTIAVSGPLTALAGIDFRNSTPIESGAGKITITSDDAATLNINITNTNGGAYGILLSNSTDEYSTGVRIAGKATVNIYAESTGTISGTSCAYGIQTHLMAVDAPQVEILDDASLNITAVSPYNGFGINTRGNVVIDTTGNVSIDASAAGSDAPAIRAIGAGTAVTVAKVYTMALKWLGAGDPILTEAEQTQNAQLSAITPIMPTMPINPFEDVKGADWFIDAVIYVYDKGLMTGTNTNPMLFSPNMTLTRGMVVTVLYRMEGSPDINMIFDAATADADATNITTTDTDAPATAGADATSATSPAPPATPFTDVAAYQWYAYAVTWAAKNDLVMGYGSGLFGPEDDITREQMATILYNYCIWKGIDVSVGEDTNILSYNDAFDISEYAISAFQWACGAGIINGKPGGFLDPAGNATRAEFATVLMRFLG